MKLIKHFVLVISLALLASCTGVPQGIQPVAPFELQRYLGTWYEIARFDHRFERGLSHITAEYSLQEDGGIKVVNRGFVATDNTWKSAQGKAYFMGDTNQGHLKVSFFGPFYSSYIVVELDQTAYGYALVTSASRDYFWILAREPQLSPDLQARLLERATALGFDTRQLIWVDHTSPTTTP